MDFQFYFIFNIFKNKNKFFSQIVIILSPRLRIGKRAYHSPRNKKKNGLKYEFKFTRSTNSWASKPLRAKSISHLRACGKSRKGIDSTLISRLNKSPNVN